MARRTFMMSEKKRKQLREEMQRELRAQERERQELMRPLFGKSVSAIVKTQKIAPPPAPVRPEQPKYPSLMSTGDLRNATAKKPPQVYTGGNIIGLAQMHKSNIVPVFKKEDAVDIARMRRN